MAGRTFDIDTYLMPDNIARQISQTYTNWKNGRQGWEKQKKELRNYIFAVDTSTTSNATLPWKNKTTRPKICQIRDNLHANYFSALFPTERWYKWEAGEDDAATKQKAKAIEAYMGHKFRESKLKEVISRCLYDFIDDGNAFGDVVFRNEQTKDVNGAQVPVYVGPQVVRLSPWDIVFDITAPSFEQSPKITRSLVSIGEIEKMRLTNPDWKEVGEKVFQTIKENRTNLIGMKTQLERADINKLSGFIADGFNSLLEYYTSGMVEFLEFEGDLFDGTTGQLFENHVITIVDRAYVVRNRPINNWFGKTYKQHCGWRLRPDNLMGMGPLDNLVGLQYRLDHLENLKADVFDLIAFPPLKVKGYVEDFEWGPYERIYMEQDSDVESLAPDTTALTADLQIAQIERTMEDMAGAPKEAMGVRTPGEKTAFEVDQLITAASRMFQHKTAYFEENFLEPLMNGMLEIARRNMNTDEVVRVVDDETGVTEFLTITPDDLRARGKLVPLGARHFAAQSQLIQNLSNLSGTGLYQDPAVVAHLSGKKIAQLLEENLGLTRFNIYRPNVRVIEQAETQNLATQSEEENMVNAITPTQTPEEATAADGAVGEENV